MLRGEVRGAGRIEGPGTFTIKEDNIAGAQALAIGLTVAAVLFAELTAAELALTCR